MHVLLVYDIPNDNARAKIANICQDYGMDRMQYSAYLGDLKRVHQEEMMEKMSSRLGKRPGKIALFAICEKDWRVRIEIHQEAKTKEAQHGDEDGDADAVRE